MAHCVASYFDKNSMIYSLRDSRNMPHCTLEIPEGSETNNQCKGKGNGPIHHKYIKYILDAMKHFKISMRDSEMQNLGYFRPESTDSNKKQIEWFKNNFNHLPTITIGNKRFYYMG